MANRSFKFTGLGIGPTPVSITMTLEGATVYEGSVPTVDTEYTYGMPMQEICTLELPIDVEFAGVKGMTVYVHGSGSVVMGDVLANFCIVPNPVFSAEQWPLVTRPDYPEKLDILSALATPPFSAAELDTLNNPDTSNSEFTAITHAHGVGIYASSGATGFLTSFWYGGDCRTNSAIDGVPVSIPNPRPAGYEGEWYIQVPATQTLTYTLNINRGTYNGVTA